MSLHHTLVIPIQESSINKMATFLMSMIFKLEAPALAVGKLQFSCVAKI